MQALQPRTPSFDVNHFEAWCTNELRGGRRRETVKKRLNCLALLQREYGFDVDAFLQSPAAAEDQVLTVLTRYAQTGHPHHHRNLVKALNWVAVYAGRMQGGDARFRGVKWPLPLTSPTEPYLLHDDQVLAAVGYAHLDPVTQARRRALVWICIATGLRRGEVGDLRVQDLDEANSTVRVVSPRKLGFVREVPLPSAAWRSNGALQTWLSWRPVPQTGPDWLWTTMHGKRVRRRSADTVANKDFVPMSEDLGFRIGFTPLRHWVGRLRRRAGISEELIGVGFGHNSRDSPKVYAGRPTWQDLSTAFHDAGLPGYRAYAKRLPPWLEEVYAGL